MRGWRRWLADEFADGVRPRWCLGGARGHARVLHTGEKRECTGGDRTNEVRAVCEGVLYHQWPDRAKAALGILLRLYTLAFSGSDQRCLTTVSHHGVSPRCLTTVSHHGVSPRCLAGPRGVHSRVNSSVVYSLETPARAYSGDDERECGDCSSATGQRGCSARSGPENLRYLELWS